MNAMLNTDGGCGKREARINWPIVMKKAAPVTGTTLRTTGPVPADSWQYVWLPHIARVRVNRVRLPILLVVS